jgi:glycosyltransferase involved in cell wall biosynthesis
MKMSRSFDGLVDDFKIILGDLAAPIEKIQESYGVTKYFRTQVLYSTPPWLKPRAFFAALKIKKLLDDEPDDTIFYIRDFLLAYFLSLVSARFRSRYFIECQSLGKFPHFLYKRVFCGAHGTISSNDAKKNEIHANYGVPLENIVVGPNGFDEELFVNLPSKVEARAKLGFAVDAKIALYAGSMLPWKGTDIIYEVATLLPDYQFVLVGADRDSTVGNIRVISKKPNREVPTYLKAADVLLAPYRSDSVRAQKYFSPIKAFEYMAANAPFVITDLPAVREFLNDDETYFVSEYTAKAFKQAVQDAIENPDERRRRAQKAYDKSGQFSWQNRAKRIVKFIEGRF